MDDTDLKFTQTAQKEASPLCNVENGLNGSDTIPQLNLHKMSRI